MRSAGLIIVVLTCGECHRQHSSVIHSIPLMRRVHWDLGRCLLGVCRQRYFERRLSLHIDSRHLRLGLLSLTSTLSWLGRRGHGRAGFIRRVGDIPFAKRPHGPAKVITLGSRRVISKTRYVGTDEAHFMKNTRYLPIHYCAVLVRVHVGPSEVKRIAIGHRRK